MSRGKRRKAQGEEPATIEEFPEVSASAAKRAWARLIKQVYEVDPLMCPRCTGPMRIIAFIEQTEVIDLPVPTADRGLWPAHVHSPPAGVPVAISPATGLIAAESTRHGPGAAGRRGRDPRLPGAYSMRVNSS